MSHSVVGTSQLLSWRDLPESIGSRSGTAPPRAKPIGSVQSLIRFHPDLQLTKAVVLEAGASVYSASAFASQELPELDVSLRGAVSIARRLQDPLAELVKIDPQSIGVGQYQHDVSEHELSRSLDAVVEDSVNALGVEVNTASTPLLSRVSGIGEGLARSIVNYREEHGPFRTRAVLSRGSDPRLSSFRQASCASATATIPSTRRAYTRKPIPSCGAFSRQPRANWRG
jgi:transcriptional accessory protein Tex/SPT6